MKELQVFLHIQSYLIHLVDEYFQIWSLYQSWNTTKFSASGNLTTANLVFKGKEQSSWPCNHSPVCALSLHFTALVFTSFTPIRQRTGLLWCSQSSSSLLAPPLGIWHCAFTLNSFARGICPYVESSVLLYPALELLSEFFCVSDDSLSSWSAQHKKAMNSAPWILLACRCDYWDHHHGQEDFCFGTGGCATIYQSAGIQKIWTFSQNCGQ